MLYNSLVSYKVVIHAVIRLYNSRRLATPLTLECAYAGRV